MQCVRSLSFLPGSQSVSMLWSSLLCTDPQADGCLKTYGLLCLLQLSGWDAQLLRPEGHGRPKCPGLSPPEGAQSAGKQRSSLLSGLYGGLSLSLCLRGASCACGRNELCFGCVLGFTVPCLRVQVQIPRSPLPPCCAPQGCTVLRVLPSQSPTASARGPGSTAVQRQCPHVGGRQVSHGSGLSPVSWGAQMLPAPLSTTFAHLSVPQSL